MAPNKFEKRLRKQLEKREIMPSANAWERLSQKLDASAPEEKKKGYLWYGIAASFIGLLIVSAVYFNLKDPLPAPDIEIVTTNEGKIETTVSSNESIKKDVKEAVVENSRAKKPAITKGKAIHENQPPKLTNQISLVKEPETSIDMAVAKTITPEDLKEEIISTKILEIVATVDSLEQNNLALSNAEVDNLLRNAQAELLGDTLLHQNGSVDAMALLIAVEDELDKSFRDQIFETLKTGFLKARTAVADRNK